MTSPVSGQTTKAQPQPSPSLAPSGSVQKFQLVNLPINQTVNKICQMNAPSSWAEISKIHNGASGIEFFVVTDQPAKFKLSIRAIYNGGAKDVQAMTDMMVNLKLVDTRKSTKQPSTALLNRFNSNKFSTKYIGEYANQGPAGYKYCATVLRHTPECSILAEFTFADPDDPNIQHALDSLLSATVK
jgi:hypothetical protein